MMKYYIISAAFLCSFWAIIIADKNDDGDAADKGDADKVSSADGRGNKMDGMFPKVDELTFKRYKDQVCNSVPAFQNDKEATNFTFMDEMDETEIYELAFLNMAYGLTSDSISHIKEDMGWRKRVLDLISLITKQSCENEVVPEMYLNAAKNLFLYYVYKKSKAYPVTRIPEPFPPVPKNDTKYLERTWMEIISMLEQCSGSIKPIPIQTMCDAATHLLLPSGSKAPIAIAEERVDIDKAQEGHEFMDEIVDAVWWMFSTTYARCYTLYYPREDWVVQFFDAFRQEFLIPFANRWKNPGPFAEYFPIVFGPFDFRRARANLRACNGAAYQFEGIPERQLVRPLTVTIENVNMLNFKTGTSVTKK